MPSNPTLLPASEAISLVRQPEPIRIGPARSWQAVNVRELWQYRELLALLVWRDVKVRYKQTVLGAVWAILQPVMMMIVFTIFFGKVADLPSGGFPYPVFVLAGLLPWLFFSTAISNAANSVVGSEKLITKVYFPRLAIPFSSVMAALADLMIAQMILFAALLYYGFTPGLQWLLLPVLLLLLVLVAAGVGSLLAALNVAYRDFRYVLPFMVQLWLFATPAVYMQTDHGQPIEATVAAESVSEHSAPLSVTALWLVRLNPLSEIVAGYRACLFNQPLQWDALLGSFLTSLGIFAAGCLYFRRVEASFADII